MTRLQATRAVDHVEQDRPLFSWDWPWVTLPLRREHKFKAADVQ